MFFRENSFWRGFVSAISVSVLICTLLILSAPFTTDGTMLGGTGGQIAKCVNVLGTCSITVIQDGTTTSSPDSGIAKCINVVGACSITRHTASTTSNQTGTPTVRTGDVLCHPKMSEWPQNTHWKTVGTTYVHTDGTNTPMFAPCTLSTNNYSVTAQLMSTGSQVDFDLLARVTMQTHVGYIGYIAMDSEFIHTITQSDWIGSHSDMVPRPNVLYTVTLTVKGTLVELFLDRTLVVQTHMRSANDPGSVGVMCASSCEMISFNVVAA